MNLIFDLDGTLINSLPGIAQSLNCALEQNQLPTHSIKAIREFIGNGSRILCQRATTSTDEATVDKIEAAFKAHYQELWKSGTEIYPPIFSRNQPFRGWKVQCVAVTPSIRRTGGLS